MNNRQHTALYHPVQGGVCLIYFIILKRHNLSWSSGAA